MHMHLEKVLLQQALAFKGTKLLHYSVLYMLYTKK
jgi:hypothetical protein